MNYLKHIFIKFFWLLFNKTKYHNYITKYECQKSFNKVMICDTLITIKPNMDKRQTFSILKYKRRF